MRYLPREEQGLEVLRRRLMRFAVICLWVGMGAGLTGALLYTSMAPLVKIWGMSLRSLRPLHLTAGTGWIYLGGLAVVVHFWGGAGAVGGPARGAAVRRALWFLLATWAIGALVVLITVMSGRYSGREYFFISIPASILFWVGWLPVAFLFLRGVGGPEPVNGQPVYRWMWMTSFGLFTYAFVETHLFLLPYFQGHPLRDMAVEWKSYGTLVGSFNLLVYGSLAYLGERLNPAGQYGRSKLAFSLFWVGVLNSFTNYGHHTFHLPQSPIVKWTSFLVSMTEIVILAKVVWDVWGLARKYQKSIGKSWDLVTWLLAAATLWTCTSLILSMLISVPPLNSLIHGTLVVAGHAMGSMLGIDTIALFAVLSWIYLEDRGRTIELPKWPALVVNVGILVLWSSFMIVGMNDSFERWEDGLIPSQSRWPAWFGTMFLTGGLMVAIGTVGITWRWVLPRRWTQGAPMAEVDLETARGAGRAEERAADARSTGQAQSRLTSGTGRE